MAVKDFVQEKFTTPGINRYRDKGDYYTLSSLLPSLDEHTLRRGPTWSSHVQFPAGLTVIRGAYYDEANNRIYFLGQNASTNLAYAYADLSNSWQMSAVTQLTTSTDNLGGYWNRNIVWRGSRIYAIGQDSNIYGASLMAFSQLYTSNSARIITPFGGRTFAVTSAGDVLKLNDAGSSFDTHFNPVNNLAVLYAAPYRQNLALVAQDGNGDTSIYYVSATNPQSLLHIARVATAGDFTTHASTYDQSCLYAIHNDDLYFATYDYSIASAQAIDIYKFNGAYVKHFAHIPSTGAKLRGSNAGLISWQGQLLLYELSTGSSQTQTVKIVHEDGGTTTLTTKTADASGLVPRLWSLGDKLILTADPSSNEGIYYADRSTLADGHLITSRYDFDSPTKRKRLHSLNVLLDGAATDFKVVIKYRTDDTAAWTTAATGNGTQRAAADDLTDVFYTIQLRIELDDDSGGNQDIGIEALSILYTEADYQ